MKTGYAIGELAAKTGVSVAAIRFYEEKGLLGVIGRGSNRRRVYGIPDLHTLRFVAKCRRSGLGLGDVQALLKLKGGGLSPCGDAKQLVSRHIKDLKAKIAVMQSVIGNLQDLAGRCSEANCGASPEGCVVLN